MHARSLRAEVTLVLALVLALSGAATYAGFKWGKSTVKKENLELARIAAETKVAAEQNLEKAKEAQASHQKAIQADEAQDRSTAGFALGTKLALEKVAAPTQEILVAKSMNDQVLAALPEPSPAQHAEFKKIIEDLIRDNAVTNRELQAKIAEAGTLRAELGVAQTQATQAHERAVEAGDKVLTLTGKVSQQAEEIASLYSENKSLWLHIKVWGSVAAALWVGSIILPPLAKSFPTLQPAASFLNGIWSPGVQLAASAARKLSADLVSFGENTKTELERAFGPKQVAEFKKLAKTWWGDDFEAQAEIERIKKRILRA